MRIPRQNLSRIEVLDHHHLPSTKDPITPKDIPQLQKNVDPRLQNTAVTTPIMIRIIHTPQFRIMSPIIQEIQ